MKKRDIRILKTVILPLLALLFVSPLLWMVSSSLKPASEVFATPFHLIPETVKWSNYFTVWTDDTVSMIQAYFNTFKIVIIATFGQIVIASMAAYAFAKVDFRGKNIIFLLFLSSMMIPTQVTIIPRFMLFKTMNLYNTHWSIILPTLFGATSIFMLRQFYMGLPNDLIEAAKIDGASMFQRILHIDIPELVPMIVLQLIMSVGNLMNVGFEKVLLLQTELNKATSDIIAVYVYEQGIINAKYSYSTAVGLFNTVVNIILLIIVNRIAKKAADVSFV